MVPSPVVRSLATVFAPSLYASAKGKCRCCVFAIAATSGEPSGFRMKNDSSSLGQMRAAYKYWHTRDQGVDTAQIRQSFLPGSIRGRLQADKKSGFLITIARFVLLVAVYVSVLVGILSSLDSAQHAHEAPGINFAYKVF